LKLKPRARKAEWRDFEACFKRRRIGPLKHFTAVENLDTVFDPGPARLSNTGRIAPGLYSRRRLRDLHLEPFRLHRWGGKGKALEDYICLCFHLPVGILRAEAEPPAILVIDPAVITWKGTCFCPTNSASARISVEEILAREDLESFENLFRRDFSSELIYRQAEILVRDHLPLESFERVVLPECEAGYRAHRGLLWLKWRRRLLAHGGFPKVGFGSWQSWV